MSAAAAARGWGKSRFGLPEEDKPADEPVYNIWELRRRIGPSRCCVMQDIIWAARSKQKFAHLDTKRTAYSLNKSPRYVRMILAELVKAGYLERATKRGWFMPLYENFETAEILSESISHPNYQRKEPGRAVDQHAPDGRAALVLREGTNDAPVSDDSPDSGKPASLLRGIVIPLPVAEKETYCPWGWGCPHLSSELPGTKILVEIKARVDQRAVVRATSIPAPAIPPRSAHAEFLLRQIQSMARAFPGLRFDVSLDNEGDWAYVEKLATLVNRRVDDFCLYIVRRLKRLSSSGRLGDFGLGILEQWASDFTKPIPPENARTDRFKRASEIKLPSIPGTDSGSEPPG